MSTSPTPEATDDEWRSNVQQSYRNSEVREIAKVLAKLEPGSTFASKLKLAMKFEDSVFTSATSLVDYRKKIQKRLKKLQKNYKPSGGKSSPIPPTASSSSSTSPVPPGAASAGGSSSSPTPTSSATTPAAAATATTTAASTSSNSTTTTTNIIGNIDPQIIEMRRNHGSALKFIVKNSKHAYELMKERHGVDRANQLYQHTQNAKQWSIELGLIDSKGNELPPLTSSKSATAQHIRLKPADVQRLKPILDQRIDNIRSHVVKLTHPDLFLLETLERMEPDFINNPNINKILSSVTQRRFNLLGWDELHNDTANVLLKAFDASQQTIPPIPKNSKANPKKEEALLHIEKMRSASQALISYMGLKDKSVAPRNVLSKCHSVVSDGIQHLLDVMNTLDAETTPTNNKKQIKLEDAWNKVIEIPIVESSSSNNNPTTTNVTTTKSDDVDHSMTTMTDQTTTNSSNSTESQQQQTNNPSSSSSSSPFATTIRSRVLLTPGRKIQPNFKNELKNKGAILVQREGGGGGGCVGDTTSAAAAAAAHIVMEFGSVFIMKIYLVPLVVYIEEMNPTRARYIRRKQQKKQKQNNKQSNDNEKNGDNEYKRIWDYYNISQDEEEEHYNDDDDMEVEDTEDDDDDDVDEEEVTVWGVKGSRYLLNNIVQKNLKNASHEATLALRQLFTTTHNNAKAKSATTNKQPSDFEIEISEATSLLHFLQLARTTYES